MKSKKQTLDLSRRPIKKPADYLNAAIAHTTHVSRHFQRVKINTEYLPILTEIINLKRQKAEALAEAGNCYDALADEYEPGMSTIDTSVMFEELRQR